MNILLTSGIYPPDIGGPANYIPKLAEKLLSLGFSVDVIALGDESSFKKIDNFTVRIISRKIPLFFRFMLVFFHILRGLSSSKYVFSNGIYEETGLALLFNKRRSVVKIVGDPIWEKAVNQGKTKMNISEFQKASNFGSPRRKLLNFSIKQFSEIITPGENLLNIIKEWGDFKNIKVVSNGVKIDEKMNEVTENEFDFISTSRLVKWKNVEKIIDLAKETSCKVLIIGDGPERDNLEKYAKDLNVKVTFLGKMPQSLLRSYMQKSKIFVLLSDYEGQSFALLEALSLGMPILASNIQANVEVLVDSVNALLVNQNDFHELKKAAFRILEDGDLRQKMKKNNYELSKNKFNLERNLEITIRCILGE